jgi:hypothetical protein
MHQNNPLLESTNHMYIIEIINLKVLYTTLLLYHYFKKNNPDYVIIESKNFLKVLKKEELITTLLQRIRYDNPPKGGFLSALKSLLKSEDIPDDSISLNSDESNVIYEIFSKTFDFYIYPFVNGTKNDFKYSIMQSSIEKDVFVRMKISCKPMWEKTNLHTTLEINFHDKYYDNKQSYIQFEAESSDFEYEQIIKQIYQETHYRIAQKIRENILELT